MAQPPSTAVQFITRSLSEVCASEYCYYSPRRFSGYAHRLQLLLTQLFRSSLSIENLPASVQTAVRGIAADLSKVVEILAVYRHRSKIFVLINCKTLSSSLHECTVAIAGWLALIDSALLDYPDLRKKIADLSGDMKQSHFKLTENEERVHLALQKEGEGRQTSKAVQSAIIMDLARALGVESDNYSELSKHIKLLKIDLVQSNSVSERRILLSLERILDNWAIEPTNVIPNLDFQFEEDAHISPLKNFLCPLTKEVMKEPVVLDSYQNYERTAINYWFDRCIEDGCDPTCPVTGQVLKSLELKPNIGLAGAIEEWINRNIDIQVKYVVQYLSEEPPSIDCIERVLETVYNISEEHPSCRYKVRKSGIVVLIVKLLRNSSKCIGTHLRSKALMTLLSTAKDEESKEIMLEEGVTRLAIHSLIGSSESEREYAVKLLLEFSRDEAYCRKIASEKGALVLLSSMAANLEHPALSNLAEEILKRMEKVEDNVQLLAAAGRFEPLLSRLCTGSTEVKIEMASLLGKMTLTNDSKEQIARQSAKVLVNLLAIPDGRISGLQALYNLSSLDDNATILIDSAVLPALTDILLGNMDVSADMKELAASTIANLVSNKGHWELAPTNKEGQLMQSESIVLGLVELLPVASPQCQAAILRILYGISSSPKAFESVSAHITKYRDSIKTITSFLEHPELDHRIHAFELVRVLSERFGQDLADELKPSDKLPLIKDIILSNQSTDGEKSDAALILANLPLSENEVKTLLGAPFVRWTVSTLKDQQRGPNRIIPRSTSSMVEGLLGLLLHFTKGHDPETLGLIRELNLMTVFCDQLHCAAKPRVKQLAALGLKNLSESRRSLADTNPEPKPPTTFCSPLMFICGRASQEPSTCPIHNASCEENSQLCLLRSNCIKPLLDLLNDENTNVQITAVEALSTLVLHTSKTFRRSIDELEQLGVVEAVIVLFISLRPGELQEKTVWMIEKILRVDSLSQQLSFNQSLVWALVEAFKHGNANTKRDAQYSLTSLKQLSGISGKASSSQR